PYPAKIRRNQKNEQLARCFRAKAVNHTDEKRRFLRVTPIRFLRTLDLPVLQHLANLPIDPAIRADKQHHARLRMRVRSRAKKRADDVNSENNKRESHSALRPVINRARQRSLKQNYEASENRDRRRMPANIQQTHAHRAP